MYLSIINDLTSQTMWITATIFAGAIIFASIGGMFSEKSGIVNISIDASMVFGALGFTWFGASINNLFIAFIFAAVFGMMMSSLLAVASINFKSQQVVTGTAINLIAPAIAAFIISTLGKTNLPNPFLNINFLGFINLFFILGVLLATASYLFLKHTKYGLRFKAAGENPNALEVVGISVYKYRWIGTLLSGAFAGIGGAMYVSIISVFFGNVQGAGFIALAILIAGQWKPFRIVLFSLLFGLIRGYAQINSINAGSEIFIYKMLPYLVTLIILVMTSKNSKGPAAAGQIYDKSGR